MAPIAWLIPDSLGASSLPFEEDLIQWKESGIECIVHLIAESYGEEILEKEKEMGFDVYHLPLRDMEAPDTLEEMDAAIGWLNNQIMGKRKAVVHCLGGVGRTSTLLIAFLIKQGDSAEGAFAKVNTMGITPQSYAQLSFLRRYSSRNVSRRHD